MEKAEKRLNEELCPDEFEICVPIDCRLLGRWDTKELWQSYLRDLSDDFELPEESEKCPPLCWSCDCRLGWKLTGEWAVRHAARVHEKIYRQALGLDQVTAIDVGFAISERQTQYLDFLSIRVHVNQKLPPEQLFRAGLVSLTDPLFAEIFRISDDLDLEDWSDYDVLQRRLWEDRHPCRSDMEPKKILSPCNSTNSCECPHPERLKQLRRLLMRERRRHKGGLRDTILGRYPLSGVQRKDLSVYCPESFSRTQTLDDIRLCLCGVPIDIVNAQYNPSITHPGGDADSGVFAEPPRQGVELTDRELGLIGRGRVNPMVGGVSVGTVTGQAGTLGTIVWDRTDGTACGLSNWHVLAGRPTAQVGQPTYQPALFDGGTEEDVVGRLKRWHLGEDGDAALTEITGNRHYASGEILGLWHPITGCLKPKLNMELRKWGRTTGFTEGFVDGVHLATNIDYGDGVIRNFRNQFHIAPLYLAQDVSQAGDSGSLVVTSFEPLEQHRQLEQLIGWLKQSCDSRGFLFLCEDVLCSLERWNKEILETFPEQEGEVLPEVLQDRNRLSDWFKKVEEKRWVESCEQLLSKFLSTVRIVVRQFCDQHGGTGPPPLECCSACESSCGSASCEGMGPTSCTCCQKTQRAIEAGDVDQMVTSMQSCPCCFLMKLHELLQLKIRRVFSEKLETLKRWEMRVSRLLRKCEAADFGVQDVRDFLIEAKDVADLKFSWKEPCEFNSVTCCEELEKIYRHLVCRRLRVEKCVVLCDEISENFDVWRGQALRIQRALTEVEKLCSALYCCGKKSKSKSPRWIVRCIDDLLKCSGELIYKEWQCGCSEKSRMDGDSPYSKLASGGCGTRIIDRLSHRDYLKLEALTYGDLSPEEREHHWFRLLQRKDLELSVGYNPNHPEKDWFHQLLLRNPHPNDVRRALLQQARERLGQQTETTARTTERAYYAVGMIFAGDTPGSPFGEFAIASDITKLQETLRFSMRPVFEPRSSFRELRERPQRRRQELGRRPVGGLRGIAPGDQSADPRGGGPQPDPEPLTTGPEDRSGNGGG